MPDFFSNEKANQRPDPEVKKYVSRGGIKIEHAFRDLGLSVKNKNAVDVGASTGGFTDFLLQNGANHVSTIDVGYGIIAWKLRIDPRVSVFERTNIRYFDIKKLPFMSDFTVVDVSFISIKTIFLKLLELTNCMGEILILFKPQFELKKNEVEKGGIIKQKNLHIISLNRITEFMSEIKLKVEGLSFSKIRGTKGNIEFWIYIKKDFVKTRLNIKKTCSEYDKIIKRTVNAAHNYFEH